MPALQKKLRQILAYHEQVQDRKTVFAIPVEYYGQTCIITAWLEEVTPTKAKEYINAAMPNRSRMGASGDRIGRDMTNNTFGFLGDPIRFTGSRANNDLRVCDGLHRLREVANGTGSILFLMMDGFPAWLFFLMDQNNPRTHVQNLNGLGYTNTGALAKFAQTMYHLEEQHKYGEIENRTKPTANESMRYVQAHAGLPEAIETNELQNTIKTIKGWVRDYKHLVLNAVVVAHYIYNAIDPEINEAFWRGIREVGGGRETPTGRLRRAMESQREQSLKTSQHVKPRIDQLLAEIHSAWLAFNQEKCPCGTVKGKPSNPTTRGINHVVQADCYIAQWNDLSKLSRKVRPTKLRNEETWLLGRNIQ